MSTSKVTAIHCFPSSFNVKRFHLSAVHIIDFVPSSADPDDNDLWSDYLPSQVGR